MSPKFVLKNKTFLLIRMVNSAEALVGSAIPRFVDDGGFMKGVKAVKTRKCTLQPVVLPSCGIADLTEIPQ